MPLGPRFDDALVYASQTHAAQLRKGSEVPYVSHLLRVTGIVLEHGGDEDEAIAALLHDAVEDQGGAARLADIRGRFGPRVAALVEAASDCDRSPKPPWKERKTAYLARLRRAERSNRLLAAADKLDNARSLAAALRARGAAAFDLFQGRREGTLWYYRAAAEILAAGEPERLGAELGRAVAELERLASTAPADDAASPRADPRPRENLRRLMSRAGLTIDALSARSGVDVRTIRGVLDGAKRPHARTLCRLAEGLAVDADELFLDPSRLLYRRFDRDTNPQVAEVLAAHPEAFDGWTAADFDELHSRFGAGGALTDEGALDAARQMNRNRQTQRQLAVLLESSQGEMARAMVELFYERSQAR